MYWSLQQQVAESEDDEYASQTEGENETDLAGEVSGLDIDDSVSDSSILPGRKWGNFHKKLIEEKDGSKLWQ